MPTAKQVEAPPRGICQGCAAELPTGVYACPLCFSVHLRSAPRGRPALKVGYSVDTWSLQRMRARVDALREEERRG